MREFVVHIQNMNGQGYTSYRIRADSPEQAEAFINSRFGTTGAARQIIPIEQTSGNTGALQLLDATTGTGGPDGTGDGRGGTVPTPPPGTTYDPTDMPSNPNTQLAYKEQAYRKGITDAGYDFDKFGGQALKDRFAPTAGNFRWTSLLNAGQTGQPGSRDFEGYAKDNAGGGRNIYNRAQELFNTIVGGGAQIGHEGLYNKAIYGATGEEKGMVGGDDSGTQTADQIRRELFDLAQTASRGKWGGWSGGTRGAEQIYDEFDKMAYAGSSAAEPGGTQPAGIDWAALLKRRLGL